MLFRHAWLSVCRNERCQVACCRAQQTARRSPPYGWSHSQFSLLSLTPSTARTCAHTNFDQRAGRHSVPLSISSRLRRPHPSFACHSERFVQSSCNHKGRKCRKSFRQGLQASAIKVDFPWTGPRPRKVLLRRAPRRTPDSLSNRTSNFRGTRILLLWPPFSNTTADGRCRWN